MTAMKVKTRKYLEGQVKSARELLVSVQTKLTSASTPHDVADKFAWHAQDVMYRAQLLDMLERVLKSAIGEDPGLPAGAARSWLSMHTAYTEEVVRWSPELSTSMGRNMRECARLKALKQVREVLQTLMSMDHE